MTLQTILALMGAALIPTAAQAQAPAQAPPRDELILEMQQAFRQDRSTRLTQLLPRVRGHVLEPWAAYWELRARLDTATAQEVQGFYTRYAGTYQEDRLRNDWLLLLGQRRQWDAFADDYPRLRMSDDRQVRCYALLVQHLREGSAAAPGLAEEVRRLWFAQRDDEDGCTLAASRLIGDSSGPRRMTVADAWHKARLAMEAGRVRAAAAAVTIVAPQAVSQLEEAARRPTRFLSGKVVAASRMRRELIGLAIIRLASTDLEDAADRLENKWGPQMPAEERDWIWAVLGKAAAQKLNPAAADYYGRVSRDAHLSDELLAWKVRTALRAGSTPDWRVIERAVDAMSEAARNDPTWAYWKARALKATARTDSARSEAQRLLEAIASPRGFYEMLALEELGQKVIIPPRPAPLTEAERDAARQNPMLQRGLYAIQAGLRQEGVREWNYATNQHRPGGLPERELLAAAQFACEREVWDRCINTSERARTQFDVEQRFPMPFRESVVRRSREIGLDPAYVYGLIRQESRFVMDARSSVGASGLMQVMPATARWTARKIGLTGFTADQITDRETNIAIGTGYLKLVLDDFGGSMPMAAAAYNAGPSRPRSWRNGPVMEAAAWAETIPFSETRDYVKKVVANATVYAAVLSGEPQSLKARLGRVGPRDAATPEPNRELP